MPKPPMIPAPERAGLPPEELDALIKDSVSLTKDAKYGGGAVLHPATMAVYFVGRHPLSIDHKIVRVPLSLIMRVAAQVMLMSAVPSMEAAEQQVGKLPPEKQ